MRLTACLGHLTILAASTAWPGDHLTGQIQRDGAMSFAYFHPASNYERES